MRTRLGWALSGPLPAKQVATMTKSAVSVTEDNLASQLSRWWDIEFLRLQIATVTGQSKDERRAIDTLKETTRFNGERYEVGLLWREDDVKLT